MFTDYADSLTPYLNVMFTVRAERLTDILVNLLLAELAVLSWFPFVFYRPRVDDCVDSATFPGEC